jgi:hypothetical protein
MSARQTFVPRSASRASNHADTEHPFDMPPRSQNSIGHPHHNRNLEHDPDPTLPTSHKNDSEKRPRFAGMFSKSKHSAKPGTGDQAITGASPPSASGRFSGVRRPDMQSLAPPRRSSSPFCGKGSPFVPPSDPGPKFARRTSLSPSTVSQRTDLTISGVKDAHISTGGVLSGLISASRVIAAPVPNCQSIHTSELDGEHTFSSNKSSMPKLQPARLLERIHEDLEQEIVNGEEALVDAHRTGGAAPVLRRMKRTIQGVQEGEGDLSLPDENEYGVKRIRIEEFAHELPTVRPDDSSHFGVDHAHSRLQPDLGNEAICQPSPPVSQHGPGTAEDLSLEGMFANMETFLNVETFTGLVHKWSTCSREEWLQGSEGARSVLVLFHSVASVRVYPPNWGRRNILPIVETVLTAVMQNSSPSSKIS